MLAVAVTACGGRATSDNEGGSTPESIDEPNLGDLHCEEGKGVESAEVVANQRGLFVAVTPTAAPGVVGGLYQRTGGA